MCCGSLDVSCRIESTIEKSSQSGENIFKDARTHVSMLSWAREAGVRRLVSSEQRCCFVPLNTNSQLSVQFSVVCIMGLVLCCQRGLSREVELPWLETPGTVGICSTRWP